MSYLSRDEIEGVWFDLSFTYELARIPEVFLNNWDYVLVDAMYFLDEDMKLEGLGKLKECDGSDSGDDLYFYLTTFAGIEELNDIWSEKYTVEDVDLSEKVEWQLAFAGMYFYPSKKNWCGIYIDCPCQDFVLLGAEAALISRIKSTFKKSSLLTVEYINNLLENRDKRFGKSN
jgi:hypothetical protein